MSRGLCRTAVRLTVMLVAPGHEAIRNNEAPGDETTTPPLTWVM